MDLSVYTRPRKFELPYSKTLRVVGATSMLWALMLGPLYYWRQGAMIEGIVLAFASLAPLLADADSASASATVLSDLGVMMWAASVLLAPLLLVMSYQRRGWVEIASSVGTEW